MKNLLGNDVIQENSPDSSTGIEISAKGQAYKVSSAQKRLFALNRLAVDKTNYNIPKVMIIEGKLEKDKVEESFRELIERHEAFRTSFEVVDDEIMQIIHSKVEFKLEYQEINKPIEEITDSFIKPFDLSKAPLFRVKLVKLKENKHVLLLDMHHIISDGTSIGIILEEFSKLYKGEKLEQIQLQYKDYSVWENEMLYSDSMKKQEEYWKEVFSEEVPALDLPIDYQRPALQSFEGDNIIFTLDGALTEKLKKISKANGTTLYMTILTAYNILLSKYSGQDDIVVGSPIVGRPSADLQNVVGMFVNTLAMRNYPEGKKKFKEFLQEVKESALGAYENQDYQFDRLVEKLGIRKDLSRNPLFDTMFVLQNTDNKALDINDISIEDYELKSKVSKFDITIEAEEADDGIKFNLEYCTKLFKRETMERLIDHFINILRVSADNPEIKISEIDMLSRGEKRKILVDFNDTREEYPKDKAIFEYFEEQAEKTPENIAVAYEDKKLTYRELNEKSNQLARALRSKGVKADTIVGIMVERSLEMIIGIMGIVKAGGAYLPISPEYPEDRIKYMLQDSSTKIVLTQEHLIDKLKFDGIVLNLEDKNLYQGDRTNPEKIISLNNLIYIIYTSGSTGNPKGVMLEHKSIVSLLLQLQRDYPLGDKDAYLLKTNYVFDVSVTEIFGWFFEGGRLIILKKGAEANTRAILDTIEKNNVTHINFVPSMLRMFINFESEEDIKIINKLKYMFTAGEAISEGLVKEVLNHNCDFAFENLYGPTESAIYATKYSLLNKDYGSNVPIGKPVANTKLYIVDKANKLQPVGVAGELCIAGDGLARGYLNRAQLTEEKFVPNPFDLGKKMYRSGDLARWLPDGNVEYIGRIDHQVKIRGFRIELGEIESKLLKHEEIKSAVVLDKQDGQGNKYLCAYIVSKREITVPELRKSLAQSLPDYMIPAYFIQLEKMPLTPTGKVNRRALPEPDGEINTGTEYAAPRNEKEERLTKIWSEVLGVEKIGIDDDFFTLGGHSLKAIIMVSFIHKELKAELSVSEIFSHPTIRQLSECIGRSEESIYSSIKSVDESKLYMVSSAQKRQFALSRYSKDETNYNIPAIMLVEGSLERDKTEDCFRKLVERHETLRTSFEICNDEIMQRIHKKVEFNVDYEELSRYSEELIKTEVDKFIKPFDLSKAPLIRVKFIRLKDNKSLLMLDMHHIISDGTSIGIIMEEFTKLYKGESLEPLKLQYKDYAAFENDMQASEALKKQEEYWVKAFEGEIPVLEFPTDYPRPTFQSFEGANIGFCIDKTLTEKLKKISRNCGATLYMTLLAAYNILLSKHSGQEDIVVGSPIAGRPHADLQGVVGMFVNTLAMRNYPEGNKKFIEFLQEVKKNSLAAYENQDYQFDKLIEKLNIRRDLSRNVLFDTMFVLQNTDNKGIELDNIKITRYEFEGKIAKFDMSIEAEEIDDIINFNLEYCTKLLKKETAKSIGDHFINILKKVAENPEIMLSDIDMLSKEEKEQILVSFNDTKSTYPNNKNIYEFFEEQVKKTPENIALIYEDKTLTYRELNEKSNQLARALRSKGVKADTIVGIMVERSLEMMIGIMGIVKAGGAYLPISPNYPEDRIKYMLEDSGTKILLTKKHLMSKAKFDGVIVDLEDQSLYQGDNTDLEKINNSNNLIYIIYTSGSTGNPKGVMIEHKSVVSLLLKLQQDYPLTEDDAYLLKTNYVFDVSVTEIFGWFFEGGKLVILKKGAEANTRVILDTIEKNNVTHINFVPSMLRMFINFESEEDIKIINKLKFMFTAGEAISEGLVHEILNLNCNFRLENLYGPTEITIYATKYPINSGMFETSVPIGKPEANTRIYIVNKNNKLQPVGTAGELCIAGDGLARGYLNKPELTTQKFVEDPFEKGQKMYRSGDLARWLPDGNIEYIGRIDHQVKIRGFRIELGEIESQLLKNEEIKEAAVIDREDVQGNKYLCAYIVSEREITVPELRKNLSQRLPDYMIPAYFMQLTKMPLTPTGKVNRKALPEPDGEINTGVEYAAPRNATEEKLVNIWKEVLGVEKLGIDEDFFTIGGHSLKAIKMASIIQRELEASISIGEIFDNSTVRKLAEYIGKTKESEYSSIEAVEDREVYNVSSAQKRLFALNQFSKEEINYNIPIVILLEGELDKVKIIESFKKLVDRHEAFRTSFELADDEIMQRIHKQIDFKVEYEELEKNYEEIITSKITDFIKPFDLSKAPLFRVKLIRLEEGKHILIIDMHHIISDGVSLNIILQEFAKLYRGENLEKLRIQYKDYSIWEGKMQTLDIMKKHEEYWTKVFSDEIPVLDLPTDYNRPDIQSFEGEDFSFSIDENLTEKLREICKANGATLYMTLLSAYNILLSKYSGQEDITIGSPIAGRQHADLQGIVGMFVNTLAMRNHPNKTKTFSEFLQEVKKNALDAFEHQNYQFDRLVEKLNIRRDLRRNALFDTMFMLQNTDNNIIELDNIKISKYQIENKVSKFDITLAAEEIGEKLYFAFEYCTKLFRKETIKQISGHFMNILKAVAENPEIKISDIDMLSEKEKTKILVDFNNTEAEYPKDKTIQELFEEQAYKTQDNIALIYENSILTYRELNGKSNQLARSLRDKGVKPDTIVGIMAERSLEMIIGIMAILKAGGAYLPIDPEYPEDRIQYMLENSSAGIVLTQKHLLNKIKFNGISLGLEDKTLYLGNKSNLKNLNNSSNLAYVIYTSGSTGKPKGVMIEHRSAVNFITGITNKIQMKAKDSILALTTISFDIFFLETLLPLTKGLKVFIGSNRLLRDANTLSKFIIENDINIFQATPSRIQLLSNSNKGLACLSKVDKILVGGEALPENLFEELKNLKLKRLFNMYGPTETTVWSSIKDLTDCSKIDIGKPIANTRIYILDSNYKPKPVGAAGELYIAGDGVARGYLNNLKLTEERFKADPFRSGDRMYKTGDLARWLPDGNIEFIGRIDNQVKIRGFRIELGEIESQLLKHDAIKEAVVVDKQDKQGSGYLCAYITAERLITVPELRESLSKSLPEYMIPVYFMQLKEMPLTPNGKINRRALPEPDGEINTGTEYAAPTNETEEKLIAIWKEILGVEQIGIDDDFFALGGHSLKAIKMVSIIHRELKVEIPIGQVFSNPTVRKLGKYIDNTEKSKYSSIKSVAKKEFYKVSSAQKRMFALYQFAKEETNYNIPSVMIIEGRLEKNKVEESFRKLIERHEAFRTSFELIDDEIMQKIHDEAEFNLEYEEVNEASEDTVKAIVGDFIKPFDLSKAPLLRAKLVKLKKSAEPEKEQHMLMVDMHHIISDGTSISIIMDEFTRLYKGESLEELKIQYKDYSAWENEMLNSEIMKKHEEYWINMFSKGIPVLNLPTDFPRPSLQSFEGKTINFKLDKEYAKKIKKMCKANGVTLYMALLAAYNVLLSKYSGQDDIVVGSPIAGRPHADLQSVVGIFINTLAMRNYPEGEKTFSEFLKEVKKNALGAYENQDYQFDKLVEKLDIKRDLSRSALFDTMFVLQNTNNKEIALDDISIKPYEFENKVSKFDLTLVAAEANEEIDFTLEYCPKLFKKETAERMIEHYKNILKEALDNPGIKLSDIRMLSEEEERAILVKFNDSKVDFPDIKGIHQLFEKQAEQVPDSIAASFEGRDYTYKELNEKANQLANYINTLGVHIGGKVAIYMERSLEIITALLGVLKSGAAYVPIDPAYPKDRIESILIESDVSVIITTSALAEEIENIERIDRLCIDSEWNLIEGYSKENLNIDILPSSPAYIIFTSGSTGKPKGVVIKHKNIINYTQGILKELKVERGLSFAIVTTFAADLGLTALWGALCSGGQLHIISYDRAADPGSFEEYFKNNSIDVLKIVPSHFDALRAAANIENLIPNKYLIFGGEASNWETIACIKAVKPECKIINHYGPTETTVGVLTYRISELPEKDSLHSVPIGKPLANSKAYILDKFMRPVPVGITGELYIGGEGVTSGYLNHPELTAEKYVTNEFKRNEKLFRTGDLARYLKDGNIEFLGRIDNQVKIRGYRIEIGEIETIIKNYPSVQDSVVIVREDKPGEKYLAAYIVSKVGSAEEYSETNLREHLKKLLPKYMLPAVYVKLQTIPLTANGKVDRYALPAPDLYQRNLENGFKAPETKEEIEMSRIWSKVLGIEKISIDDDFFDLGGDSFKAIRLVRSISNTLGVMELFKNSTIRELTAYLSKDTLAEEFIANRTMLHELTRPIDEKNKAVSIICLPYGGGSAISYQPLANCMPKNYSLYAVELPGHDFSCPDEQLASIEDSAARCFEEIKQKVKGPIVLFGHCLGASMAVLLTYMLEEAGMQVDGVFMSAMFPAPRITNKFFKVWNKIFPDMLSDRDNQDMLKTIGGLNKDISHDETEFIVRNLKHDLKESTKCFTELYADTEKSKFKAPISCVVGDSDRTTEFYQERYKEWEHFSESVDLKVIKYAGHFFFKNQAEELANIIKEKVELWQKQALPSMQQSVQPKTIKLSEGKEKVENRARSKTINKKQAVPSMKLFLIVAIVQIISEIGTILSGFGSGVWVYKQTGVLSQFAIMFLFGVLPAIVMLPISGAIVDRFDRRIILILSDILSAACSLSLLIMICNNSLHIWQIYVFTVVAAISNTFRQPAYMAAITQISPKMYLMQANSVAQFSGAIGGIIAPICGGVFMDFIGFKGLVTIDLITFVISMITLALIRFPDTMFTRLEEPIMKELSGGWNFIIKRRSLVIMVLFFLVSNFLMSIFDVTMTPLILSYSNSTVLGIVSAFSGAGALVGSIAMLITGGTKKRAKGMVGFVISLAVSIIIASIRPLPVFAAIALFGFSFSLAVVNIHWQSLIQVKVGLELQGRVFAINQMMVSVLRPVSYITAAILADKVFEPIMSYSIFNSPIICAVLGTGAGRAMRVTLFIAGAVLLIWSIMGFKYKPLSEMDDILEDAVPDVIIIKDKDKLQEMADRKIEVASDSENLSM